MEKCSASGQVTGSSATVDDSQRKEVEGISTRSGTTASSEDDYVDVTVSTGLDDSSIEKAEDTNQEDTVGQHQEQGQQKQLQPHGQTFYDTDVSSLGQAMMNWWPDSPSVSLPKKTSTAAVPQYFDHDQNRQGVGNLLDFNMKPNAADAFQDENVPILTHWSGQIGDEPAWWAAR